jgi:hypothetical protein
MKYIIMILSVLGATLLPSAAFAYTYTNVQTVNTATIPKPTCIVSKTTAAPNEKILFTPASPTGNSAQKFMWIGEATTTTYGPAVFAFIYPGTYTVVLRAVGFDGSYAEALCPTISILFDAKATSTITLPATYLFPFAASTTKSLIPKEFTPLSKNCFNLLTDLSIGYSDDVSNPTEGVIYKLQVFLANEGYLKSEPTGYFGVLTHAAAKAFQKANGLPQTGFVGPMTREVIKNQTCLG